MKKISHLFFFIFCINSVQSQNVNFDWVAQFGGFIYEEGHAITVDGSSNIYSVGIFGGTVDFDPGPGVSTLTTINGAGYISKLDKDRNFIWVKQIEGTGLIKSLSIKTDASGNVYIAGFYYMPIDLDPGPAVVTGPLGNNFFLVKLDAAGNFILGKTFGHSDEPNARCNLGLDPVGNIYISGVYDNLSDFDPGPGTYMLPIVGGHDIFVLKLDQNANFVWAKGVGSNTLYDDESNAMAVDANGNVLVTGKFGFVCDFDPGPGAFVITSPGVTPYVLKLNTNGGFVWAKHFAVITSNADGKGNGIAVDQSGNIFVGGYFGGGILDFDPGPAIYTLNSTQFYDAFICKLDAAGNFLWAKGIGGSSQDLLNALTLDAAGNIYTTGNFHNTVDFDPGPGIHNLTSAGQNDVFILKLNTQGGFEWAKNVGNPSVDEGTSIATDATGSVYTLGSFVNTADMDPDAGIVNITALGYKDIFLLKLSRCTNGSFYTINASVCNNYILNNLTYTNSGTYIQVISNSVGCDSTITLNLTINRKFSSFSTTICEGQTYYAGGANQTTTGIYKDTLLTSLGCDSVITTTLFVNPKPKPDLGPDGNICMDVQSSITPGIFSRYLWQDNSTLPNYTVSGPGRYWVTVTGANNCTATDTLNIITLDTIPNNFLPPGQELCYGNSLKISVPGYADYLWSTGSTSADVSLNSFGTFYLIVKDHNNCTGSDTITLQRKDCINMGIPNAFTPNGDTRNDIFKPTIFQEVKAFSFIVFNRYGQKVFETTEYGRGWDGSFKGKTQPAGSYVYRIKFTNIFGWESIENGTVLLLQ